MTSIISKLNARRSTKAQLLSTPAPDQETLIEILQTGMSAPDHGAIRPWRFTIFEGETLQKLSDIYGEAFKIKNPDATEEEIAEFKQKPLRAPLVIAIWAEITENHPKVPPIEQIVTVSCATENILLAAEEKGFGAVLLTGWPAFHPHVQSFIGMKEKDEMIGFLYLGTATETPRPMTRPDVEQFIRQLPVIA